jgi:hypothetical protein
MNCTKPAPRSRAIPTYTIGAIFLVYGLGAILMLEFLSLVGLQAAQEGDVIWHGFVFTPVIPALLALSGWALMRGSSWGYGAALLLPLLIVPLAVVSLNASGRPATLTTAVLQTVGVGAVLASLSVPLSFGLLFLWVRTLAAGKAQASNQ